MNLYIVALFRFKENYLMDAFELLRKLVHETRKEEGCLQYDLVEDKYNKGIFFIVELWESEEHHFKHDQAEHLADFRINSASFLEEATQVYKGFKVF
ncbi:MAG: putative quinol monooxygenase [Bergeyella sp.]